MTNGSLMKVESTAECLGAFCNTFDLHKVIIGLENPHTKFGQILSICSQNIGWKQNSDINQWLYL